MTPTATATPTSRRSPALQRALTLYVVLTRASNAVHARLESVELSDLTRTEFGILEALYHKGPLLLGDLQRKILLSSGGVTYAVDRLAERGLVERRDCASDRRARYAALTAKGDALISKVFPLVAARIQETMSALSAEEQEELTTLLRTLGHSAAAR